jgi:hypothetical protein
MGKKICTTGIEGAFSYMILDTDHNNVLSLIQSMDTQIIEHHLNYDQAFRWTEKKLRLLNGRDYEID